MKSISLTILISMPLIFSTPLLAAGDADAGKNKASSCGSCHGAKGEGSGENPKIAGMSVDKFTKALKDYKSGSRKHMMMEMMVKNLSDEDIADMAAFYTTQ